MKLKLIILFLFINATILYAQKESANWYFGELAGLSFNTNNPVPLLNGKLITSEGCATISDPNGNLLFYTDGLTVYNRNHTVMQNGTNLFGDASSTQSAIIVPKPDDPNIYYIFTVDIQFQISEWSNHLRSDPSYLALKQITCLLHDKQPY